MINIGIIDILSNITVLGEAKLAPCEVMDVRFGRSN